MNNKSNPNKLWINHDDQITTRVPKNQHFPKRRSNQPNYWTKNLKKTTKLEIREKNEKSDEIYLFLPDFFQWQQQFQLVNEIPLDSNERESGGFRSPSAPGTNGGKVGVGRGGEVEDEICNPSLIFCWIRKDETDNFAGLG